MLKLIEMSFWNVFISKLGVRFYSCLRLFTYLMHFMKGRVCHIRQHLTFYIMKEWMPSLLITSIFLWNAYCTDFIWVELNWNLGEVHFFSSFLELDFLTECYTYVGFFHVEGYSCLLLLFSLVDISWIFQCQLSLHHLSIKNILQMMLLTSKSHICGRSTGELFPGISEKQLLCLSK